MRSRRSLYFSTTTHAEEKKHKRRKVMLVCWMYLIAHYFCISVFFTDSLLRTVLEKSTRPPCTSLFTHHPAVAESIGGVLMLHSPFPMATVVWSTWLGMGRRGQAGAESSVRSWGHHPTSSPSHGGGGGGGGRGGEAG